MAAGSSTPGEPGIGVKVDLLVAGEAAPLVTM